MVARADDIAAWSTARVRRTIVVVDVVESVRLMQADEDGVIRRWRDFVDTVRHKTLAEHPGRLVKSLGDGLLLAFEDATVALAAAFALHRAIRCVDPGTDTVGDLCLRIGLHVADVLLDELDVYGNGVNLASRLAALASPGETVGSAGVRDLLADGVHCRVVDLGECFLKHYAGTVRAFRLLPADDHSKPMFDLAGCAQERPVLAVIPFACHTNGQAPSVLGDVLADEMIATLSANPRLKVIARLSTQAFRDGAVGVHGVRAALGAAFVVTGSYRLGASGRLGVQAELCDLRDGSVLRTLRAEVDVAELFDAVGAPMHELSAAVSRAIVKSELRRVRSLPMNNLEGYTLYIAGIHMMNSLQRAEFDRARELFEHLCERHPRAAAPRAMLAKWHGLRMAQGWAEVGLTAGRQAQFCARRALDIDPGHALALSMDGLMTAQLDGDLDAARSVCEAAVEADPQDPHAWMSLGAIHGYRGDPVPAEALPLKAVELSPLDPARFLFDVFVAAGKLTAGKYEAAAQAARDSIRLNRTHAVSYKLLTIALSLSGRMAEAEVAAGGLLRLSPTFRVTLDAQRYAGRDQPHAALRTRALLDAGLPL